ncbi:MAG: hypothetical protein ABI680_20165, partial [Chthoniobacteraceae bacterium]
MKRCILLVIVAAAGFGAGRWLAAPERIGAENHTGAPGAAPAPVTSSAENRSFAGEQEAVSAFFSALQHPNKLRRAYELQRDIELLDPAQIRALVERVVKLGHEDGSALIGPLMARWVALDPEGAAAWSRPTVERVFVSGYGMDFAICDAWCAADPEAALALALTRPHASRSARQVEAAVGALAGNQPAAQVRRAAALPEGKLRDSAIAAGLSEWAKRSPAEAFVQLNLL